MSDIAAHNDPFDESLWGEYARMFLIGTAACSAAAWATRLAIEPSALVMVIANVVVMGFAVGNRFAGLRRLAILSLVLVGIVVAVTSQQDRALWWSPLVVFSPAVTVGGILVLVFRDGLIAIRKRAKAVSLGKIVVWAAVFAVSMYMVVVPSVDAFLEIFRERPQSYAVEDLSPLEVLRVRSAKLAVFAIFAYAGACVGSFLNVVAASAPRGEPIALRSSNCPQCGVSIRRVDNLPILSYLRLRGRCRDCQSVIPVRYFAVEVVGLSIFAALFLYELITGAANVPGFQHYHHAGILWIILYTKWPVVGIYLFHCAMFSCVLMLALMEQQRLRSPGWMMFALPAVFSGLVVSVPTLLTISLGDQTPLRLPTTVPEWMDRAATCAIGGTLGWTVGLLVKTLRLRRRQSTSSLPLAFLLLGVSLGWQAVLTIAVLWLVVTSLLRFVGGRHLRPRWLTATTLLFVVAMLHHPAWKFLASNFRFENF
ncbi:MAG: prepilin peptidase [Planctomycetota bacterium]